MSNMDEPAEDADLEALSVFLASDQVGDDAMTLPMLDGMLTAIAIGPTAIPPEEWLPLIWGSKEPAFEQLEDAERTLGLILARYNAILDSLRPEVPTYAPIFWQDAEGNVRTEDWAEGFLEGVGLDAGAWEPVFTDDDVSALFTAILIAGSDEDGIEEFGLSPEEHARFVSEAADMIPTCVVGLADFWSANATDDAS